MKHTAIGVLCSLVIMKPVFAEAPYTFDPDAGYYVVSAFGDRLIVNNDGHSFLCEVSSENSETGPVILENCRQFLTAQEVFIEGVPSLPEELFSKVMRQFLIEQNCSFTYADGDVVREQLEREFTQKVAAEVGYTGPITDDVIRAVGNAPAGRAMLDTMQESGEIVLDDDSKTISLVDCK